MSPKLTEQLLARFPRLFSGRAKPETENLMCYGFSCGDGWFDLLWRLCEKLDALPSKPVAVQVKQKWGGLRFYLERDDDGDGANDGAGPLIAAAEEESFRTCELCGEPGRLMWIARGPRRWARTSCVAHGEGGTYIEREVL